MIHHTALLYICKDGVMSNHSVSVFISGPTAGGPAMTLWRLWWDIHLFFEQQLHSVMLTFFYS